MIAIGKVSSVVGTVIATDELGNQRTLSVGDDIFEGETIVAAANATVNIQMLSGDNVVIADGQQWRPTQETFTTAEEVAIEDQIVNSDDLASVDSIQQALLSGQDPTQFGEATAAGAGGQGTFGANGDGGTSFVSIDRTAGEFDPEAGYETIGTQVNIEEPILDPQIFSTAAPIIPPAIINIVATDPLAIEGADNDNVVFTINSDGGNGADSSVQLTISTTDDNFEAQDIASITITDASGQITLTSQAEIIDFLANGRSVTLTTNGEATVVLSPVDDDVFENSESFSANISAPVNATIGTDSADAQIDDETTPNEPPREGDKPTVNIVATKAVAVEGESVAEFEISQTSESNFDTTVQFTLDLGEIEAADIQSITYTDANGTTVTVSDIADFIANGVELTIPANSTAKPVVTITPVDDAIFEKS